MRRVPRFQAAVLTAAIVVATGLVATGSPAQAFCTTGKSRWGEDLTPLMGVDPSFPTAMRNGLEQGILQWNRPNSALVYSPPDYNDAWRLFRFIGSFQDTSMFGPAPAYAFTEDGGTHELASLYLSQDFTWINGNQDIVNGVADTQTIVVHEMGHVTGLNHPDPGPCTDGTAYTAAEQAAVMTTVRTGTRRVLNSDDIAGVQSLY